MSDFPPIVRHTHDAEFERYAQKATRVVIRHVSGDEVVGLIEIVSPGNKHSEASIRSFCEKIADAVSNGCHLLVVDLHSPTPRHPRGLHARFWQDHFGDDSAPDVTAQCPLGLSAY